MRKPSVMMLTLLILAALFVPMIPRVSAPIYLSGTWNSWLYVWKGGVQIYTPPTYPNPPAGFPGIFVGWCFLGTVTSGTWTGTLSAGQISGTLSGTYSWTLYDTLWNTVATGSTPMNGNFGPLTLVSGSLYSGIASGTFSGPDITGFWIADITIDASLGGQGTITFNPTMGVWPGVNIWVAPYAGDGTEWIYGQGTVITEIITESTIRPPIIFDPSLVPGSSFDIEIVVDDITDMRAYQFILSYDTNVLQAIDWESLSIFTIPAPADIGLGYIAVGALSPSLTGLTTSVPVAIARITFLVYSFGWSRLDIHDSALLDVNLAPIPVFEIDGGFANIAVADLKGRGAWPEVRHFKLSEQPDTIDTLYARVATNTTGAPVNVKAVFTIYDELGIPLGTIETGTATLPELSETVLTVDFDTTAWVMAGKVLIEARAYYDINGDGIMDSAGPKIKSFSIKVSP